MFQIFQIHTNVKDVNVYCRHPSIIVNDQSWESRNVASLVLKNETMQGTMIGPDIYERRLSLHGVRMVTCNKKTAFR